MKVNTFSHEVTNTSAIFGRKSDVRVVFEGDQPCTNGKRITLPAMSQNKELDVNQQMIIRGYVDHEAGHVRYTDFEETGAWHEKQDDPKLAHSLANSLEDVWLERKVIRSYPGALKNLKATVDSVNKMFMDEHKAGDEVLGVKRSILGLALTWEGRLPYGVASGTECLNLLPKEIRDILPGIVEKLDDCDCSMDVCRVVEQVIKDHFPPEPEPEPEPEPGKGKGKSEESEADEPDSSEADEESEDESLGPDSDEAEDEVESDADPIDSSLEQALMDVIEDVNVKTRDEDACEDSGYQYTVFSTAQDMWIPKSEISYYNGSVSSYDKRLIKMTGEVNILRRKLEKALLAKMNRDWDHGRLDGRLDTKRLVSAVNGNPHVFKWHEDRPEMDTALTMLVDLSGSMNGAGKVDLAMECTIALAEAIDRTGIAYEVLGFRTGEFNFHECSDEQMKAFESMTWDRIDKIVMYEFKTFRDRLQGSKSAISRIAECASGANADGESVALASNRLRARLESRKILLVLSDGMPDCFTQGKNRDDQRKYLREEVMDIERSGIEVIGIGIMTSAVRSFYRNYAVVDNVSELSKVVIGKLSEALL